MKIDLSCPAEILRAEPPKENEPFGLLLLFNLSDRTIVSCEATFRLLDREGNEIGRAVHRARALGGRPHTAFTMTVPIEPDIAGILAEATLDKAWYADNDVWRRNPENETEYEPNVLAPSHSLNALKFTAGETAVGFPSQQAEVWVCVCGRPNSNRSDVCARCLRRKDSVFALYNRNEVEKAVAQRERQLDLKSRSAREEDIRLQRIREEEFNRHKQRSARQKRLAAAFLCAVALTVATVFGGIPAMRLVSALRQTEAGQYEQARELLRLLGTFPGAKTALADCENRIARRDATSSADPEILQAAAERLRTAGDKDTDEALANEADFSRAGLLLAAGYAAESEELLLTLPENWPGRQEKLNDCIYAKASAAMESREYETARTLFLSLGSERDAEAKAKSCLYEPALILIENGDYDGAILLLEQISDYEDSETLIRKSLYLKGFVLESEGKTDEAREAYLAAGNYDDAQERANAILKDRADALMDAKDYAGALPLYQALDTYADSREKWIQCAVTLATKAYKSKDYPTAIELLDAIPEQTKESETLQTKAIDQAARAAAKKQEYAEAIALMERIPDYKDAQNLIRNWKYALAQQLIETGKAEEAIPLLEELGNYRNAPRLLKEAQEASQLPEAPAEEVSTDGN